MRPVVIVICAVLTGCAGNPQRQADTPAKPDPAAMKAGDVIETADPDLLMAAQGAGYKVVNENGQQLLCRKDLQTGSRTRYETSCLTIEEWEVLARSAKRSTEDMTRRRLPPPSN